MKYIKDNLKGTRLPLVLLITILAGFAIYYIVYVVQMVPVQHQLTDDEGVFWYIARQAGHGFPIYKDVNILPYISFNFPPVYPYLVGVLIRIFGSCLEVGRLVSVFSFFVTCFLIYKIVNLLTRKKLVSILAGMLPFAVWFFTYWSVTFRSDMLGIPITLLGVYMVLRWEKSKKLLWSIPIFALAIFTKQSLISAPIAVSIYLLLKNRKLGIQFIIGLGVLVSVLVVILEVTTNGYFLKSILESVSSPHSLYSWEQVAKFTLFYGVSPIILALSLVYLVIKKREPGLLGIYFLISLVVLIYSASKAGAWVHYSLELVAVGSILLGLLLSELYSKTTSRKGINVFCSVLIVIIFFGFTNIGYMNYRPYGDSGSTYSKLSQYIKSTTGPILADDETLLMVNGRDPVWEPTSLVQCGLSKRGWNQSPIIDNLESRTYPLVIMEFNISSDWQNSSMFEKQRITPEIATSIMSNYKLEDTVGRYWVYVPS